VYLTRFKWDEAKFPTRRPLRESVDKILEIIGRIEDDLKVPACLLAAGLLCIRPGGKQQLIGRSPFTLQVKVGEYNSLKTQLNAVVRKQSGSLSVRDISTMVKPQVRG
jgi:V-type H+-transporting ATPase subunit C